MEQATGFGFHPAGTSGGGGGSGTVTSVGLSLPDIFTVSGSPVTTSGTLVAVLVSEAANTFFAAPDGSAGTPTFRLIVNFDLANTTVAYLDRDEVFTGSLTFNGDNDFFGSQTFDQAIILQPGGDLGDDTLTLFIYGSDPGNAFQGVPFDITWTAGRLNFNSGGGTFTAVAVGTLTTTALTLVPVYRGATTAGNGLTSIHASVSLTNQGSSIGTTTLFTPPADGTYRVSVYQQTTTAGSAGTLVTTIGWTDDVGATTTAPASSLVLTGTGRDSGMVYIKAKSGVAITYSTTVTGALGSPKYALNIEVERLS